MTAPASNLVWTDTPSAVYLRVPSLDPHLPLGGKLIAWARRVDDGTWQVKDVRSGLVVPAPSKDSALIKLRRLGGGS